MLFLIAAMTGCIPWLIDLAGGQEEIRKSFIEIYDKLTFLLFVYIAIHVMKKMRWFIPAYKNWRHYNH